MNVQLWKLKYFVKTFTPYNKTLIFESQLCMLNTDFFYIFHWPDPNYPCTVKKVLWSGVLSSPDRLVFDRQAGAGHLLILVELQLQLLARSPGALKHARHLSVLDEALLLHLCALLLHPRVLFFVRSPLCSCFVEEFYFLYLQNMTAGELKAISPVL